MARSSRGAPSAALRSARGALAATLVAAGLAGCTDRVDRVEDPLAENVIDEAGLGNLLLSAGDPEEAIRYFSQALAAEPERADYRRGLAISLARAKRLPEAARIYQELVDLNQATPSDRLDHAYVLVQLDRWDEVAAIEAGLPQGLNTSRRHLLTALLADRRQDWTAADAAYARAEKLTTNPARIYNNWGVSHQARGDLDGAARLFEQALGFDSRLFSAKNNLAMTRGLQGNYRLPVVPMTETEKATILNNLGVIAMRKGQRGIAKGLFAEAVETHPQYYQGAADRLAALETGRLN